MSSTTIRYLLFSLCLFTLPLNAETSSQPAFWEIRQGDATVYLFGSMHFGHSDFYPLPKVVEEAFAASDRLVVEVDILKISPTEATQAVFKYGGLAPGESLAKHLSSEAYQALARHAEKNRLPVSAFDTFQPWYVSLMLVEAEIRKTTLQQQLGIDLYFLKRASGKKIDELESIDSQLSLFSGFSATEQEQFLMQTLDDLQHSQSYLVEMAKGWRSGDIESLESTLIAPFRDDPGTKAMFDRIFSQRNFKMSESVKSYLRGDETVFFVVGVGHMLGDEGIVALLQKDGLTALRVAAQ